MATHLEVDIARTTYMVCHVAKLKKKKTLDCKRIPPKKKGGLQKEKIKLHSDDEKHCAEEKQCAKATQVALR